MADHIAYVVADTEEQARARYGLWTRSGPHGRRAVEDHVVCFKGLADARYMLAAQRGEAKEGDDPKLWTVEIAATEIELAPSDTGVPPYKDGDIITVYDREYGITYQARVGEVLLAGVKRPWLVEFESVNTVEPGDSRSYCGSLEAHDNGTSPNIVALP